MSNMPLLVKLTDAHSRQPSYIDSANIRILTKDAKNPLLTMVITYHQLQTGQQSFEVLESVEECGRLVNAARAGKDLSFN
jgi:hypothetical protein